MYGCSKIYKKYVTRIYEKREKERKRKKNLTNTNNLEQFQSNGYLHVGIKKEGSSFSAKFAGEISENM